MMATGLQGLDVVMANLQREISRIKGASARGVMAACDHIRVQTETVPYTTPLDYGNLRASWFAVNKNGLGKDPAGYSGQFRRNVRQNLNVAHFKTMHTTAINEAKGETTKDSFQGKESVIFGYSANYAMWVHENLTANFTTPGTGPRWFQDAIDRNRRVILEIIREHSQIK